MTTILVGAPVLRRGWSLPSYFEHVATAADRAGVDARFVFVGGEWDRDSWDAVDAADVPNIQVYVDEPRTVDTRFWEPDRFRRMVVLRNVLLNAVREAGPDLFLSLDTDILLHPDALCRLLETITRFDAVGGAVHLAATGRGAPNYMIINGNGGRYRQSREGTCGPVTVIMACKLMTPAAYSIDYEYHHTGEDTGWSLACGRARLKLGWDSRTVSKHLHSPELLHCVDRRCGW